MSFTMQCQRNNSGVPNLGDASPWGEAIGLEVMITWVQFYQWGVKFMLGGTWKLKGWEPYDTLQFAISDSIVEHRVLDTRKFGFIFGYPKFRVIESSNRA
jgi:hypothetical protein